MMSQFRLILGKNVPLVIDADNGDGYACVEAGGIREICHMPTSQFHCKDCS